MKRQKVDNVNKKSISPPDEVFESVHAIMHLFRSQQYQALRNGTQEMTHMEGKLLGFFAHRPGATLSDLVVHSGRDKGQLGRLIKSLKDGGLLQEQAGKKEDRRSVRLELTRAGQKMHETLHRQSDRLAKLAIKGLNGKEHDELLKLLRKVRGNLESSS